MTEAINITFSKVDQGYKLDKINNIPINIEGPALDTEGNPIDNFVVNNQHSINIAVSQLKQSLKNADFKEEDKKIEIVNSEQPINEIPTETVNSSNNNECPSQGKNPDINTFCDKGVVNSSKFKEQAKIFHPDTNFNCSEEANKKMQDLNNLKIKCQPNENTIEEPLQIQQYPQAILDAPMQNIPLLQNEENLEAPVQSPQPQQANVEESVQNPLLLQNGENAEDNGSSTWETKYPYTDSNAVQDTLNLLGGILSQQGNKKGSIIDAFNVNKGELQKIIESTEDNLLKDILGNYINSVDGLMNNVCEASAPNEACIEQIKQITREMIDELKPDLKGGMNIMNLFANKSRRIRSKHKNKTRRNKKTRKNQQKRKAKRNTRK